jgi:hypothetical protein
MMREGRTRFLYVLTLARSKITTLQAEQLKESDALDEHAKQILDALARSHREIEIQVNDQYLAIRNLRDENMAIADTHAIQTHQDHELTRAEIGRLSLSVEERDNNLMIATIDTQDVVELAIDQNAIEHDKTRLEMQHLKEQAERQIEQLTEQIRQLKVDLEASVKEMVSKMATASAREQQNQKDITKAKFNLWVALELMLEKLKVWHPHDSCESC